MTSLVNNLSLHFNDPNAFEETCADRLRTKIVCTIGPKTKNVETLTSLIRAGMNVARMNFSHGSHEYHAEVAANVREAAASNKLMCAIMLDTKGPEIRTGKLVGGKDITLVKDETIVLTTDMSVEGTTAMVAHTYEAMSKTVHEGSSILVDDGLIELIVTKVRNDKEVECRIKNGGELGEKKGVNLPAATVELPALTAKDKADLKFGCEQRVDMVAASFIRKASDVHEIRAYLEEQGGKGIKIISKIENQEGLINFDSVLEASDGIMVARGDLGVEIPIEKVATAQKMMISKCNVAGKPVITATQMLDSMITNPRPTRAEMTDVANAVIDGSDCVMLSGETAKGAYPVEAVKTMVRICAEAEKVFAHESFYGDLRVAVRKVYDVSIPETIASSAVKTSFDVSLKAILCLTETGNTARLVCKYRPMCPVVPITAFEPVARQLMVHSGALPVVVDSMVSPDGPVNLAMTRIVMAGVVKVGDLVGILEGPKASTPGATNVLRVMTVPASAAPSMQ